MKGRSHRGWQLAVLAAVAGVTMAVSGQSPDAWLATVFDLSPGALARVDRGGVVAEALDVSDGREIALVGAARIDTTPHAYLQRMRDVSTFMRGEIVEAAGTFGVPATIGDLARLSLTSSEVEALRQCRVGSCSLQVPASVLDGARRLGGGATGTHAAFEQLFRQFLVDMVNGYRSRGPDALPVYADDTEPVSVARETRDLLDDDDRVLPRLPDLRRLLVGGTSLGTAETEHFFYWARHRVGRASVVTVTHVVLHKAEAIGDGARVAASMQLYASHYFDASVGLTLVWPAGNGSTLTYYNRSRVDTFGGVLGGLVRRIVRSRARSTLESVLAALQRRVAPRAADDTSGRNPGAAFAGSAPGVAPGSIIARPTESAPW